MHPYICFFGLNIPLYGLCMTLGFLLCGFLTLKKAQKMGIMFEDVIIIAAVTVGASLFGGGLLYIIVTYSPGQIFEFIKNFDFSFITNSGLVFYGGLAGGISGAVICSWVLKVKTDVLEICAVPYIPLGHAIGRIGCLMAGCCYGFEYDGIFSVRNIFLSDKNTYFPIQAVEALFDLVIMLFLLLYAKKHHSKHDVLFSYLFMYSVMRFFTEFFRGDEARGVFLIFSTSQWISISIIACCVIRKLLISVKNKTACKII